MGFGTHIGLCDRYRCQSMNGLSGESVGVYKQHNKQHLNFRVEATT
jgi:hypothetical protein